MRPNECCNQPENVERKDLSTSLSVETCRVCGCNHYEMAVDPVVFGVDGEAL